jgi:hypothetical protein
MWIKYTFPFAYSFMFRTAYLCYLCD